MACDEKGLDPDCSLNELEAGRLAAARERIADLEHYVGEHLSNMGACHGSDDDSDESLCTNPQCTYCEMARALQPIECGKPLTAREVVE